MSRSRKSGGQHGFDSLLRSLAAKEDAFLGREFLAPAVTRGSVHVRIGGVICRMSVEPKDFVGCGIFQPYSHTVARLVRRASLTERRKYLELFPAVRLILCRRAANAWLASAGSFGDGRFEVDGLVPVLLCDEVQVFDCIRARYDGRSFWFDEVDVRHDPGASAYLREAVATRIPPMELSRKGITAEERAAYELMYCQTVLPENQVDENSQFPGRNPPHRRRGRRQPDPSQSMDPTADRIAASLSHAGARLVEYLERGDSYRVTYLVDGRRYTSSVSKQGLGVQVAGICLSGEDAQFDLASLVGVLREADGGHGLLRIGDEGMNEDDYWRMHPPRRPQ